MDKLVKGKTIQLANGKTVTEKRSWVPIYVLLILIFTWLAMDVTRFNFSTLMTRGSQFFVILGDMMPPNWGFLNRVWQPLLTR